MRRLGLLLLSFLVTLGLAATQARATVVDMSAVGQTSVQFDSSDTSGYYGVALVPNTRTAPNTTTEALAAAHVPYVVSGAKCDDPALTSDLTLPDDGICYHGGPVMHDTEVFALTWDPLRRYWSGTRDYVEQFLRDVAEGSGTLSSPYAVTTQYRNATGVPAGKAYKYGGGCVDYGNPNHVSNRNTTCLFPSSTQTGPGNNYPAPASQCPPAGQSYTYSSPDGSGFTFNDQCITDAQIRTEVRAIVSQMHLASRTQPGYQPEVVLPVPPRVEVCLDKAGTLCSANGSTTPPLPQATVTPVQVGGVPPGIYRVEIAYATGGSDQSLASAPATVALTENSNIVISSPGVPEGSSVSGWYVYLTQAGGTTYSLQQALGSPVSINDSYTVSGTPNSAGPAPPPLPFFCSYHSQVQVGGTDWAYVVQPWTVMTQCDEPDSPSIPQNPPPAVLSTDAGIRLVSPLSQAQLAATVNPQLNGWFNGLTGSEINDNGGCVPLGDGLDSVTVGKSSQNPYLLQHEFNNAGVMESDPFTYFGCAPDVILSPSFVVPSQIDQGEVVSFDGSTTASTLIVPNAGYHWSFGDGSSAVGPSVVHSFAKAGYYHVKLTVTDRGGNVRSLTQTVEVLQSDGQPPPKKSGGGGGHHGGSPQFKVHLQLLPQSLNEVLHSGLEVRVSSNQNADGFATLSIPQSAAKKAHIHGNRTSFGVVVGRGTVSGIKDGSVTLRVRVSSSTASQLSHLSYLSLTLRLVLTGKSGAHDTVQATGSY